MKQYPSKLKFKKNHKLSKSYFYLNENKVFFPTNGLYAIKSCVYGLLSFKQIEACRKSIKRNIRKSGKIKLNTFTYHSKTSKGLGVRMGKGKGSHDLWVCPVRAGQVICEIYGLHLSNYRALLALKMAASRLPFKTKIIKLTY